MERTTISRASRSRSPPASVSRMFRTEVLPRRFRMSSGATSIPTIGTVPSVQSLIAAGKLRPIAVTTAKRSKALPDVPTFAESGVAGYDIAVRVALMAPAGTPPEVIEKLNKDVGAALKSPEVASELEKRGLEIDVGSPKDLADAISTEAAGWGRTIKERGISLN